MPKMNYKNCLPIISFILTGCPVASAYEIPEQKACVIDRCSESLCYIETPEGWVQIKRTDSHYEGKRVTCPVWLVEPT